MNIDPLAISQRIDTAWQQHLRDIGIDPDQFPDYDQPVPGGGTIKMRCYPDDMKRAFNTWLQGADLAGLLNPPHGDGGGPE